LISQRFRFAVRIWSLSMKSILAGFLPQAITGYRATLTGQQSTSNLALSNA
jgi:hypothetical protein